MADVQSLSLTDPPVFDVDDIEASLDGTHVLLSGPQGVACVELPSGWTGSDSAKPAVDKIARSHLNPVPTIQLGSSAEKTILLFRRILS